VRSRIKLRSSVIQGTVVTGVVKINVKILLSPFTCFGDETYVQTDAHDHTVMGLLFSYFGERIC
jgi:hypothetical protein